jgi:3-hydroxybutyryl-CoA dehydrogenase
VTCSVWNAFYNDPRFAPSLVQKELLDAGFLGKKTGRGFFDYRDGTSRPAPKTEAARDLRNGIMLCGESDATQALAERLTKSSIAFDRLASADSRIAEVNGTVLFVTDGRSATQRAADTGIANTVLVDLALDYRTATRLAIATASQCADTAADAGIALLQAAGLQVSRLADVPGLAVMRTVTMLANEAADAVNQGVCSAAAADAAMRLGVNYPKGPLAWADAVGLPAIRTVLAHLGTSYGEDRYRVSPLIAHHVFAGKNIHV